jgi:hypothetical protein
MPPPPARSLAVDIHLLAPGSSSAGLNHRRRIAAGALRTGLASLTPEARTSPSWVPISRRRFANSAIRLPSASTR